MKWFSLKIKRKLMTGLSVFWVCAGMAVQTVGEPSISLSLRKGTLKELFVAIENKSDYKFVYDSSEIDTGRSISAVYSNQDISTILSETLVGLSYEIKGNQIIIRKSDAQEKKATARITVSGKVTDANGEAIIGANILEKAIPIWQKAQEDMEKFLGKDDTEAILRIGAKLQELEKCSVN